MKLTQAFVRRVKCDKDKSKQVFYDDNLKGFLLEVKANGRKTYYLRYIYENKKTKYTKIGDATILPVKEARTKALKLKRSIEEGKEVIIDTPPVDLSSITLYQFYLDYYLPYVMKHVKSWTHNDSMFRIHILPLFGKRKMNDIKKHEIMKARIDIVHKKKRKPATANKFLIFLSQAYNLAIDLELQGITDNPAKKIKVLEENNTRERFITKREAKRLMKAVNESKNPNLKYIIPFLLLTGARRGEVLKAQWKDINLNLNIWTIPISKSGKKRVLPISEPLRELILSIKELKKLFAVDEFIDLEARVIVKGSVKSKKGGINHDVFIKQVNAVMKPILGKGYTSHSFRQGLITEMGAKESM